MYKTSAQLKQDARRALTGKWGVAVLMTLVTSLVSYSLSIGTTVSQNPAYQLSVSFSSIISSCLNIILSVGMLSFFLKLSCGLRDAASFKDLFFGFQCHPFKAILLSLMQVLYLLPAAFIYVILLLLFVLVVLSGTSLQAIFAGVITPMQATAVLIACLVLTILYFVYVCYISLTYSMVFYLLLDYPELSVTEIWKRSAQLMKGNKWRKFKLDFSFIPWLIVSVFTFFIGFLWVSVYINAANTEFYLDLAQHANRPTEQDLTQQSGNDAEAFRV